MKRKRRTHSPAFKSQVALAALKGDLTMAELVKKLFEFMDSIENSLELHPVPFALIDGEFALPSSQSGGRMHYPSNPRNTISTATNLLYSYPQILLKSRKYETENNITYPTRHHCYRNDRLKF